ncbi:hypothetical protein WR25_26556 [Diploscapter pachys]|uniref:Uncharacterized protein n=1 Tax=Diploscapter pachys TaxID=2018661 RepID=A0A2A2M5M9_9BILA|nr:hypothetical protein WR25_26556 [Diploscapter pachys]
MTMGRGNSGAKTDPDDNRLHKWNCDAASIRRPTAILAQSGSGRGHSQRAMTISAGMAKTRLKMGGTPAFACDARCKRGTGPLCPSPSPRETAWLWLFPKWDARAEGAN